MRYGKYSFNADGKTKQQIVDEFIKVCRYGTSKQSSYVVREAARVGISYEELVRCINKRGEI